MRMTMRNTESYTGHRVRLKERFAEEPSMLADYETLELLLGYVLLRKDTKPLAKELLKRFGNLRGVFDARPDELEAVPGFGPGLVLFWTLLRECWARCAAARVVQREVLSTPHAVAAMARARLTGCPHEECWLALVDNSNRCIAWERIVRGGVDMAPLTPRDVLERALVRKASGIILVHNHPGGSAKPSVPDIQITQALQGLCVSMGMRFLDHIIVTDTECRSLVHNTVL